MAEKPTKKSVMIAMKRERRGMPKIVITTGFKLRFDKTTGLLDVSLEACGQPNQRVNLDPAILSTNLDSLKRYAAGLAADQEDSAQKDEVPVSEHSSFANVIQCSNMGIRSETIFGVFSIADWVDATRSEFSKPAEVTSIDAVVAITTPAVQKKMILEIVLLVGQLGKI